MTTRDQYIHAATRDNTRRSYRAAIQHFEVDWGGLLPATADTITTYLTDHAGHLSINTLKQRLAALAKWHSEQGFPDPTKTPLVKTILKGMRVLHPTTEKQAKPLQLEQLQRLDQWLRAQAQQAYTEGNQLKILQHSRNRALVLLGFWRGFRSDELCRLQTQHLTLIAGEGMTLYLPSSKGDRENRGRTYQAPALKALCPVEACIDWLAVSGGHTESLFCRIDRWGRLSDSAMNPGSIIKLLRNLFAAAGLVDSEQYSSHSLRRGFASWANANRWDVKTLMEYVGWRDVTSAMRYIDGTDPFQAFKLLGEKEMRLND